MEARSFHALPTPPIRSKKPCANKFNLDCLLMQFAGANRRWRWPFRYRGSRHESAVVQLSTLGHTTAHEQDTITNTNDSADGVFDTDYGRACSCIVVFQEETRGRCAHLQRSADLFVAGFSFDV